MHEFLDNLHKNKDSRRARKLEARVAAGIEAAEAVLKEWNGKNWMQAAHLVGALCIEERRRFVAFKILALRGYGEEAARALGIAYAAAGKGGRNASENELQQLAMIEMIEQRDDVDEALQDALGELEADDEKVTQFFDDHGMLDKKGNFLCAVERELLLLLTLPSQDTAKDPVFSMTKTPVLYNKFISILFVGFAHNLLVESYVSRVATVSKAHPGLGRQALGALFMYKVRLQNEKGERRGAGMRSTTSGGGRRKKALETCPQKKLKHSNNKAQLRLLGEQAAARAAALQQRRTEYFSRDGEQNLGNRVQQARKAAQVLAKEVASKKVRALIESCEYGPSGGRRQRPFSAEECMQLLPCEENLHKNRRGNVFKNEKVFQRGRAKVMEGRKTLRTVQKLHSRKRKRNQRELNALEGKHQARVSAPPKAGKPARAGPSGTRAQTGKAGASRRLPDDSSDSSSDDESGGDGSGAEEAARGSGGAAEPRPAAARPQRSTAVQTRAALEEYLQGTSSSSGEESYKDDASDGESGSEESGEEAATSPASGRGSRGAEPRPAAARAHVSAAERARLIQEFFGDDSDDESDADDGNMPQLGRGGEEASTRAASGRGSGGAGRRPAAASARTGAAGQRQGAGPSGKRARSGEAGSSRRLPEDADGDASGGEESGGGEQAGRGSGGAEPRPAAASARTGAAGQRQGAGPSGKRARSGEAGSSRRLPEDADGDASGGEESGGGEQAGRGSGGAEPRPAAASARTGAAGQRQGAGPPGKRARSGEAAPSERPPKGENCGSEESGEEDEVAKRQARLLEVKEQLKLFERQFSAHHGVKPKRRGRLEYEVFIPDFIRALYDEYKELQMPLAAATDS